MFESQTQARMEFIKDELQNMIIATRPNARISDWRRTYRNYNEWTKIRIADKAGAFYRGFRGYALSLVDTSNNPGNQSMDWFERFAWNEHTLLSALRLAGLTIEEITMYIEEELEYEEIFLSAREDRYKERQIRAVERAIAEAENN